MAENKSQYDVFISHSSDDGRIARRYAAALREAGISYWLDVECIPPGASYPAEIIKGIEQSEMMLLLYSSRVKERPEDVLNELEQAKKQNKTRIPVLLDKTEYTEDFEYYLSRFQWIDATTRDENETLQVLIKRIQDGLADERSKLEKGSLVPSGTASTLVVCPVCGKHNVITETFKCKVCGRDHLCLRHFSDESKRCSYCVEADALVEEGKRLEESKEWTRAADCFRKVAKSYRDSGAAQWAEFCMGRLCRDGQGVERDLKAALQWFRKAAARKSDAADLASKAASEVLPEVLAERVGRALKRYWQDFRIIHGVRVRDVNGREVPLAGLVASNRGIFVGVSIESLSSGIRDALPQDNPAWPFADAVAEHCGLPTEGVFGALVVPDDYPSPDGGFPFWVVREGDVAKDLRSASQRPDWERMREDVIRKLEKLPMTSAGAEANALLHFSAPVPEWEYGAVLLPKVEKPSPLLLASAQRAAVELKRDGRGASANVFSWVDSFAGTVFPMTVAGVSFNLRWIPTKGAQRAFWMGETPVTQQLWLAIMGCNPSQFKGDELRPVEMVSWDDCQEFLKRLNALDEVRKSDFVFRLPIKEEWEHACRAGSKGEYCRLADGTDVTAASLGRVAWFRANSDGTTHPVAQKMSNAWGLYDMHGNVGEWTQTGIGANRVERGASWRWPAEYCKSSLWDEASPLCRYYNLGFRLCADYSPKGDVKDEGNIQC